MPVGKPVPLRRVAPWVQGVALPFPKVCLPPLSLRCVSAALGGYARRHFQTVLFRSIQFGDRRLGRFSRRFTSAVVSFATVPARLGVLV